MRKIMRGAGGKKTFCQCCVRRFAWHPLGDFVCFTKVGHKKCVLCRTAPCVYACKSCPTIVAFRLLIRRVQVPPRLERAVDELVALSEGANRDLTTQDNVMLAADRLSLQLRNAGASVVSALPGVPAASAAVAAIGSSSGLSGSGPATNRLLSLLINAVRVGVEAYAVAIRMAQDVSK
jgi:hypothetical protein